MIKISKTHGTGELQAYVIYADDEGLLEFLQLDEGKESFGITSSTDGTIRVFPVNSGPKFRPVKSPATPWRIIQAFADRKPDGIEVFGLTEVQDYEIDGGVMAIRLPRVRAPFISRGGPFKGKVHRTPPLDRSVRKMETVLHDFKDLGNVITTKPRPLAPDCIPELVKAINTLKRRMNGDLRLNVDGDGFLEAFVITEVRYGESAGG